MQLCDHFEEVTLPMGASFFGLTTTDKEAIILEPFFLLGYYFGMNWETYYNFPVAYKRWLIKE
jgi:hypothetical protein